jgi:hypothetical protein
MSQSTSVSVATHILSEAREFAALAGLRPRTGIVTQLVNTLNIDGQASLVRKIPRRTSIADAVDDVEGATFSNFAEFAYTTAVTLTPTGKVSGINPTVKALRRRMNGATYEQVKDALRNGSVQAIGMLAEMMAEIEASHMQPLEKAVYAEFANATTSSGSTGAAMSFAFIVDSQTELLDDDPEHYGLVTVLSTAHMGHLKQELLSASGGLAAIWSSGIGNAFLAAVGGPDQLPAVPSSGAVGGYPIYVAPTSLMTKINALDVDCLAATFCVGRGPTGMPGSLRGFAEICEGFAPSMSLVVDEENDTGKMIGRYEWDTALHTDVGGIVKIIAKTAA